ncbi:hypothetical protein [Streptomyces sp. PanSC9]|uniref:hypothetical protein n=1 Tax=Streptomyces sp. PanSC9 TaxID=1520461 RepID=UPI000FBEF628|nr:hypothetical protein [Streptomyces sp. PanSC9]ROP44180.1 hypothetical protein EDD94_7965 [Streptomyces sp. PanSC9]
MNRKLRMTAASVAAAVALGIAGPATEAMAQEAPSPARVAATQTFQLDSASQARALTAALNSEGISAKLAGSSAITVDSQAMAKWNFSWVWRALSKVPGAVSWSAKVMKKAWSLGKTKGIAYFKKKLSELSSWSPTKWVWKSILGVVGWGDQLWALINWIAHHH